MLPVKRLLDNSATCNVVEFHIHGGIVPTKRLPFAARVCKAGTEFGGKVPDSLLRDRKIADNALKLSNDGKVPCRLLSFSYRMFIFSAVLKDVGIEPVSLL